MTNVIKPSRQSVKIGEDIYYPEKIIMKNQTDLSSVELVEGEPVDVIDRVRKNVIVISGRVEVSKLFYINTRFSNTVGKMFDVEIYGRSFTGMLVKNAVGVYNSGEMSASYTIELVKPNLEE